MPPLLSLVAKLVAYGMAKATAEDLVEKHSPQLIGEKIAYVEWLNARNDKRAPANAAGFLVAAIRNDYPLPKDFLQIRERKKKPQQAIIASKATPRKPANTVHNYLATLSNAERVELEMAAVASADPITAEGYYRTRQTGGQAFAAYQNMVIDRYLKRLAAVETRVA